MVLLCEEEGIPPTLTAALRRPAVHPNVFEGGNNRKFEGETIALKRFSGLMGAKSAIFLSFSILDALATVHASH